MKMEDRGKGLPKLKKPPLLPKPKFLTNYVKRPAFHRPKVEKFVAPDSASKPSESAENVAFSDEKSSVESRFECIDINENGAFLFSYSSPISTENSLEESEFGDLSSLLSPNDSSLLQFSNVSFLHSNPRSVDEKCEEEVFRPNSCNDIGSCSSGKGPYCLEETVDSISLNTEPDSSLFTESSNESHLHSTAPKELDDEDILCNSVNSSLEIFPHCPSDDEEAHDSFPSFIVGDEEETKLKSSTYSHTLTNNENEPEVCLKSDKIFLIAEELMTTEKVYIDALRLLVVDFKEHVEVCNSKHNSPIIPSSELDKVFNTLPQILSLNEDLLSDLESRINSWDGNRRIADVVVRKGPFLKLYTTYMKDFESQCNYLDECCLKYPKFYKTLKEFESSSKCKMLTLKHYMLKPVQRIPHYRLLLEDYLNHLDKNDSEYSDTETALRIVKDVLHHANSSLKLADNFGKLLQIQSCLGNYEIIKPGRLFIKEGELKKLSRKETQLRFIILLSDCLLYAIYTTSIAGLKVKYELPLSGMKVCAQHGENKEFNIITNTRSFTLRAKTDDECIEWVDALQTAIKENNCRQLTFLNKTCAVKNSNSDTLKLGKEAPVWIQDKSTTMCQICTAEFTVTFRRHHCRSCGKVVCGDCSSNKAPLQYLKFHSARVCKQCYVYLLEEFENPESNMKDAVKSVLELSEKEIGAAISNTKSLFKKMDSAKKIKKYVPQRLKEVTGKDSGSSMSGWLYRKGRKEWKRMWFVLKEQVLYVYKASHDVAAHHTLPVLGYSVHRLVHEEDLDVNLAFKLTHAGQTPLIFLAPSESSAEMWIKALSEASVLK